jgi:small redox-active disulfide protein 2
MEEQVMKIEVVGTGCPKCKKTYENAQAAIAEIGRSDIEIIKIENIMDITARGIMMTPALSIDGAVKCAGKVPSPKEIADWIKSA